MNEAKYQLLCVLQEAISEDYHKIKQAEETLKQWENEACFMTVMQDIFYDQSVEHNIRFMSGIYLKNSLDRIWKTTTKSFDEKRIFRERILQFIQEPSRKLALQNAIIASKIARFDYPDNWPQLFSTLIHSIESASLQHVDQARLLHYRILEMLSELLPTTNTIYLSEATSNIFQAVVQVYLIYIDRVVTPIAQLEDKDALLIDLDIIAICVKCLRVLMVNNIKDFHKFDETRNIVQITFKHLGEIVKYRSRTIQYQPDENVQDKLEDIIEEYGSFYLGIHKSHPVSTVLCPAWLDILNCYWQSIVMHRGQVEISLENVSDQYLLQGMLLTNFTIKLFSHKSASLEKNVSSLTEEEKQLQVEAARLIQDRFLTQDFILKCAEVLITQYMQLTTDDLLQWDDDPEGWANTVDTENWEFELRPCAETTFMNLLNQYADELAPLIINLIERLDVVTDQPSLLLKDAVYAAIGLGAHSLYGRLDFESLTINRFVAEVVNKDHQYKILRRRIAWILGKWVVNDLNPNCKRVIYEMLIRLMAKNEDLVVRLTSAFGLKLAVDDFDFDINIAVTYLGSLFASLLNLLKECEDPDTTMKLISTVNTIMEKGGHKITPYSSQLIQLLVPLWNPTANPLLQSSLVITFTKLTKAMNERSFQLQPLLIPMLRYCTDLNNEAHIYLLEDSLDLWWTMLQTTPMPTPFMMPLFPNIIGLIDSDIDNFRKLLKIIESYTLLDPQSTLQPASLSALFEKLASKILICKADDAPYISKTIDLILQRVSIQMYGNALVQSGLLTSVLSMLLQSQLYDYALMFYMNIFARLAIYNADFVIKTIQLIGQQQQAPEEFVDVVLDSWIKKSQSINQKMARRLSCLGFTSLLSTKEPAIIRRLPEIMDILVELTNDEVSRKSRVPYDITEDELESDAFEVKNCAEKLRRNMVYQSDPVFNTDIVRHIQQTLGDLSTSLPLHASLTEKVNQFLQP